MLFSQAWTFEYTEPKSGHATLSFGGNWQREQAPPDLEKIIKRFNNLPQQITLTTSALSEYDSYFVALIYKLYRYAKSNQIQIHAETLPESIRSMVEMALSSKEHESAHHIEPDSSLSYQAGVASYHILDGVGSLLWIIGGSVQSFMRYLTGRVRIPFRYIFSELQANGPDALGIVGLIAFLIGVTLAYIGAQEMKSLGASIFVANLVVVGLARELAPLMTAIVMAGRTAAAIGAEIGSMQADDEIDALQTMAIRPMDYLVTPKIISLLISVPLLTAYANVLGNAGGILVALGPLKLSLLEYLTQAQGAFELHDFFIGLGKAVIFGYVIAIAGSLRGLQCGRSSEAVGRATTSAVVTALVLIIITNVLIDVVLNLIEV